MPDRFNTVGVLDELGRDVRQGLRLLRRKPTFALVVLMTLAIGIGANATVFSVVNGVLLKPLPYPHADQLIAVQNLAPGAPGIADVSGDLRLSPSMFFTYSEENRTFQHIGIWFAGTAAVTGASEPEQVRSVNVSHGTLEALGVPPLLGRWLSQADQAPTGPATVMLAYGYWQRRFGADRNVIGRAIAVDSIPREIVGVMPQGFKIVTADADVIVPLRLNRSGLILPPFGFEGVARLKPGTTIADASADLSRMLPIWLKSWPAFPGVNPRIYEDWRITPALRSLKQDVVGNVVNVLWVVMGTIGIVMLIACANVANLLLVRADGRQQELAVRAALGAGSWRIVRELLVESMLLGGLGGVLGLGVAYGALRVLVALGPASLPRLGEISIDTFTVALTLAASVLSGLLFGLIPALKYAGPGASMALHRGGRTSSGSRERNRLRSVLVVVQVALALVLLVSSGLMIRTFQALRTVDPGFTRPEQLQILRIAIPPSLVPEPERVARAQYDIVDTLAAIAGVTSVGFSSVMPMEGLTPNWDAIVVEGRAYQAGEVAPFRLFKSVSPGLFRTMGTKVVAGREYTWTDLDGRRPVIIVSENLARELWDTPSAALGRRIRQGTAPTGQQWPWQEIIGVVQDVHENGVHEPPPKIVYWASTRQGLAVSGQMYLAVTRQTAITIRSQRAGTESFLNEVRQAVWSVNASLPLASVTTMRDAYERSMARTSFTLVMLAIAAAMALVLGVIGIYGVISYTVSQRTREIGIRLALGAQQAEVRRWFVWHGVALACIGVMIGAGAAVGVTRLMRSVLFEVSPLDPMTYAAVALVLTLAAALASYVPARRASAVSPVEALTAE